jgi:arsenite-transporting ATPase
LFTGKGGVGKTSLSAAVALYLADAGQRVLLVSTDAASNLDEMLGIELSNQPVPVPGAPGLSVLNIDPTDAAEAYRQRVVAQMAAGASASEIATVREQLSGACTTEIACLTSFRRCWPNRRRAMTTSCSTPRPPATPCGC